MTLFWFVIAMMTLSGCAGLLAGALVAGHNAYRAGREDQIAEQWRTDLERLHSSPRVLP